MKIEGECLCGKIAYEAHIDPAKASICNCTDCQTLSGSPFRASVPARAEEFHIRRGEPKIYIKTAESGTKRAQGFCGDCGSPVYSSAAEDPALYNLRLGMVKQRAQIPAHKQIWCNSALEWAQHIGDLPGTPKG
ncbi:MAG TPA: GFA family protein [Rhizomicrobium sp.]